MSGRLAIETATRRLAEDASFDSPNAAAAALFAGKANGRTDWPGGNGMAFKKHPAAVAGESR